MGITRRDVWCAYEYILSVAASIRSENAVLKRRVSTLEAHSAKLEADSVKLRNEVDKLKAEVSELKEVISMLVSERKKDKRKLSLPLINLDHDVIMSGFRSQQTEYVGEPWIGQSSILLKHTKK